MRIRGTVIVGATALAILLGGCASPAPVPAPTVTSGPAPATLTPTTAAPRPTATNAPSPSREENFVSAVTSEWRGQFVGTDADLLNYGEQACTQLRAGTAPADIQVLARAETDQANNALIVEVAGSTLCPDAD